MDERKSFNLKWDLLKIILLNTGLLSLKVIGVFFICFLLVSFLLFSLIPTRQQIQSCFTTNMYKVYLCPTDSQSYVPLKSISNYLKKIVVFTEDSTFYSHNGFDFNELEKSFKTNLKKNKFVRGGSTITQQLAKNLFLSKDKTFSRKAHEALITIKLEKVLSKNEILEKYLNVVQFGKNIFGVKKASEFYFGKDPKALSLVESAFLAFLLPSPEKYSLSFAKKELSPYANKRLHQIVEDLYEYNRISEDEYREAKLELEGFLTKPEPEEALSDPSSYDENQEGEASNGERQERQEREKSQDREFQKGEVQDNENPNTEIQNNGNQDTI